VVLALGLAGGMSAATDELRGALAAADERGVRRVPPRSLAIVIAMSRRLGLAAEHGTLLQLATELLPASERASLVH
jgi:hypothetical protein